MANKEQNPNGAKAPEGTQEGQNQEPQTTVVTVPQKTGLGTALRIGGGLVIAAAFTGLGWLLHGLFGGGSDEEGGSAAETEHPAE